jgi:cytochrome c-type biogenesis protein
MSGGLGFGVAGLVFAAASATVTATATLALGAGVATFFSPCAYALLPGYVGYYVSATTDDPAAVPLGGALARGLAATVGVALVFAALAALIVLIGRPMQTVLTALEPVVGLALVGFGLAVITGRGPAWHTTLPQRRASTRGFVLFGAAYAIAAAGCVAPLFLAIVLRALTYPAGSALLVLGAYAAGFSVLMLAATVAIAVGRNALLERLLDHRDLLESGAGAALVLGGLGQLAVTFQLV